MGAVAYAPKVVTIWEGFKEYFRKNGFDFDFVLYSNYERQVEAQFSGEIDIAWNSPLAWVRAEKMAKARGLQVKSVAMRDTDLDLSSVLVARNDSGIGEISSLRGKRIGFGAIDSPPATLIPKDHMRAEGLVSGRDFAAVGFDVLGGKHGDHIGGERDAAQALISGEIDAAWMIDGNYLAFSKEGTIPSGSTRIIGRTGLYDHCNFTTSPDSKMDEVDRFVELLLGMQWEDPEVRPLLELEGLRKWLPGRDSGYALLERAVEDEKFYGENGEILIADYRY
ncbi:MAG: PhnD/SsuA/transferrin family substrate-binding protein [Burkholderiales bacterium]|nr:PhnD/SsuA/transferrin family substrate-binding protein [Burkholderiales bacterium]